MKNRLLQSFFISVFFLLVGSLTSQMNAQSNNTIDEVRITKADTFKDVRAYIDNNFDYANVESAPGVYNADVKFNIGKDGKIENVKSTSRCKNLDKELENTLKEMLGKVKTEMLNEDIYATTFVMPVKIILEP